MKRGAADIGRAASGDPAWRDAMVKAIAWFAMLAASLLNFLNFNDYPLLRGEVAILLLASAVLAATLAALERAAPRLAFVFTGLLVALGADLNMSGDLWPPIIGLIVGAVARFRNAEAVKLIIAAFATVFLFQLAAGLTASPVPAAHATQTHSATHSSRPPIVHLMLDSYMGLEGMSAEPAFADLRAETAELYRQDGFRIYRDAYSRHMNTANSVPYFLSFGNGPLANVSQLDSRQRPARLAYFDRLAGQGYEISVFGADYLDLCTGQPVNDCRQFNYSGLEALDRFPMTKVDRAKAIGTALASMSLVVSAAHDGIALLAWRTNIARPMSMRDLRKTSTPKAALSLIDLKNELAHPEYGKVYFAHVLLPHEPYVFDADCSVQPRSRWHTETDGASRGVRLAGYAAQTRCMHRLLDDLADTLRQSPAGRKTVMIVQGDHGSRIVETRPTTESPTAAARDFAMSYSTIFAIRAPGIEPGTIAGRASVDELLGDFARSDFRRAPAAGIRPAEVILADRTWIPRRRIPLPDYGTD
jgi:hypothetical protein